METTINTPKKDEIYKVNWDGSGYAKVITVFDEQVTLRRCDETGKLLPFKTPESILDAMEVHGPLRTKIGYNIAKATQEITITIDEFKTNDFVISKISNFENNQEKLEDLLLRVLTKHLHNSGPIYSREGDSDGEFNFIGETDLDEVIVDIIAELKVRYEVGNINE